jgi:hypothetical protein
MEREDPIDERTTAVMELAQQADGVVSHSWAEPLNPSSRVITPRARNN